MSQHSRFHSDDTEFRATTHDVTLEIRLRHDHRNLDGAPRDIAITVHDSDERTLSLALSPSVVRELGRWLLVRTEDQPASHTGLLQLGGPRFRSENAAVFVECVGDDGTCPAVARIESARHLSRERVADILTPRGWSMDPALCPQHASDGER